VLSKKVHVLVFYPLFNPKLISAFCWFVLSAFTNSVETSDDERNIDVKINRRV